MTSDELEPLMGAMTERPWRISDQPEFVLSVKSGLVTIDTYGLDNDIKNAAGLAALANHADAFVELVRACEGLVDYAAHVTELPLRAGTERWAAMEAALAKMHAVGREGK